MKYSFLVGCLIVLVVSCKKDSNEATSATINILSPTGNAVIAFGEEVHIEGTIVADGEINGYKVYLSDDQGNNLLEVGESHVHSDAVAIHEHWLNNVSTPTQMTVLIEVSLNHDGDKVTKQVAVTCQPE